ncbi:MAG TPA: hypothetical protein VIU61_28860 [Kofleriaceae bacterium]
MRSWLAALVVTTALVVGASVGPGCYAPEFSACTVRCRITNDCPSGFACLEDKFCHASTGESLCACKPVTCDEVPDSCGDIDDTCGGTTVCPDCTPPLECGGGGTPNVCGDPGTCTPLSCASDESCGPSTDSCGQPRVCPDCPVGKKCDNGHCVPCTPDCDGELACGDDGCGRSCGSCPDDRWDCHSSGTCCIRDGERCTPLTEGCNCCPGLFCISGFCTPASGCAMATDRTGFDPDAN